MDLKIVITKCEYKKKFVMPLKYILRFNLKYLILSKLLYNRIHMSYSAICCRFTATLVVPLYVNNVPKMHKASDALLQRVIIVLFFLVSFVLLCGIYSIMPKVTKSKKGTGQRGRPKKADKENDVVVHLESDLNHSGIQLLTKIYKIYVET